MIGTWMRRIGQLRLVALATIAVFTGGVLLESAEARVGRGRSGFSRSFGSRGSRSFDGNQPGSRMQPLENARTPRTGITSPLGGRNNFGNNRGSWLQRNPLLGGLLGAVAGTMIGSMIMNAFGGMNGGGGIVMLLLMGGLALMLVMAAMRFFKGNRQPTYAGNSNFGGNSGSPFGGNSGGPFGGQDYGNTNYGGFGNNQVDAPPVNNQTREQGKDWTYLDRVSKLICNYRCRDAGYGRAAISIHPIQRAEESLGSLFTQSDTLISRFYHLTGL